MSDESASTQPLPSSAARSAPTPERSAPPKSSADTDVSSRSAAWIADALFLSRYAGLAVENHSVSIVVPSGAERRARRAASTAIVVVSSS